MLEENAKDFPVYHLDELFPDQLAVMKLLGSPPIIGSHGTSIFLSNPRAGVCPPHYRGKGSDGVAGIGAAHAVTYTCPVVSLLGRPRMVLPNGDLSEVEPAGVCETPVHWALPS